MKRYPLFFSVCALFMATSLWPSLAQAKNSYQINIRVISAQASGAGIDAALKPFARDLKAMPFKSYKLLDSQSKRMRKGESVSMQFPGPKRFLKVKALGRQGDKFRFTIAIDSLRFRTTAAIPEHGTLVIGGPKYKGGVILLALSAAEK